MLNKERSLVPCYLKSEADKVIADLEESHKKEVGQLLIEIAELKNRIAPKQSDKTHQERLNEVCEKHGVSTLQDLDWAFCESEKMNTKYCIEACKVIADKDAEIEKMKEERRWRKFPDEKPEEDIKFLVINEKGFMQCCYYSTILHEFQIPVTHWMPLPSAPKEKA